MKYSKIRSMDISNGEGVGVAIFFQGCHFHCNNCFNKSLWSFEGGKELIIKDFLNIVNRDYITRISLLGGEPLDQPRDELNYFCNKLKKEFPSKNIWVYTGYLFENITNKKDLNIDVLVDGQYIEEYKDINLKFKGSSNQRIINYKKSIEKDEVVLWNLK